MYGPAEKYATAVERVRYCGRVNNFKAFNTFL